MEDELIFNENQKPGIRAGSANLILPAIPIFLLLSTMVLRSIFKEYVYYSYILSFIVSVIGFIILFRYYMSYVSRISINANDIVIVCSLTKVIIPLNKIKYIKTINNLAGVTKISIKIDGKLIPRYFNLPTIFVKNEYVHNVEKRFKEMIKKHKVCIK